MADDLKKLTYGELQKRAKVLGIRYVGVKRSELEKELGAVGSATSPVSKRKKTSSRGDAAARLGRAAGNMVTGTCCLGAGICRIAILDPAKWLCRACVVAGREVGTGAKVAGLKTSGWGAQKRIRAIHEEIGSEVCRLAGEGTHEIDAGKGSLAKLIREVRNREKALEKIDTRVEALRGDA